MILFRRKNTTPYRLVFPARRPHWFSFRLVFVGILSLALHVSAFYLFEVIYPPGSKTLIKEGAILLLDPEDPEVLSLLARHDESLRAFSGHPRPANAASPVEMRLGFENHTPRLMPLTMESPRPAPRFPSLVRDFEPADVAAAIHKGRTIPIRGHEAVWMELDGTPLIREPGFPPKVAGLDPAALSGRSMWSIGYDHQLRIRHVLPLGGDVLSTEGAALRRTLLMQHVPDGLPRPEPGTTGWVRLTLIF